MKKKVFLHLFGTHGSGKTTAAASIGKHLGVEFDPGGLVHSNPEETCLLLGKQSGKGKYNGMDGAKIKQIERFQLIEDHWDSPHELIIVDGAMLITWSSFFSRYVELPESRLVWGVWLMVPNRIVKERFKDRSGRPWTEKREKNVDSKRNSSVYVFGKAKEIPQYRIERMKHYTEEHFQFLTQKITRLTGLDLDGCKLTNT